MSEKKKRKSGRPNITIDWNKVDQWLHAGSNGVRIAAGLGVFPDTLYRAVEKEFGLTFSDYAAQKHAKGEMMIEVAQFDEAVRKRDRGMLIWLGKQRLGQRENQDVNLQHSGQATIYKVVNFGDNPEPTPYQHKDEVL